MCDFLFLLPTRTPVWLIYLAERNEKKRKKTSLLSLTDSERGGVESAAKLCGDVSGEKIQIFALLLAKVAAVKVCGFFKFFSLVSFSNVWETEVVMANR